MRRIFSLDALKTKPAILLCSALVLGSALRFIRLGSRELSIDESLSWFAAAAPSVTDLLRIQHEIDSGKLPVHELALRGWMHMFGESEAAMRAMSALIGSLSIVLVFILALEILSAVSKSDTEDRQPVTIYLMAAFAALLFAVGLPEVEIARQARMYSMTQAWIVAQVIFLLRARRLRGLANYAGLSIFTALAVATNFTAFLVLGAEGLWLIYLFVRDVRGDQPLRNGKTWRLGAALVVAMVLLLPFASGFENGVVGAERGDFNWIAPPGRWEPFATFEGGLGSWVFPFFLLFAILGGVRMWRTHRDEAVLTISWLLFPPVVLLAGSYLFTSMLVTRYLISSFVPMLILTAIGIQSLHFDTDRAIALAAIVILSIVRVSSELRPGDDRWRRACELALAHDGAERRVGACHDYFQVSYYLGAQERDKVRLIRVPSHDADRETPGVVIVFPPSSSPRQIAELEREYPEVAEFKNILVIWRTQTAKQLAPNSYPRGGTETYRLPRS
jgi:4-amino-4-deoxy-L-arabinose transferase-like glycosyltransferase